MTPTTTTRARRAHPIPRRAALAALALAAALPARALAARGCPDGMKLVEGGTFDRDEGPVGVPTFCIDVAEVTARDYAECVESGSCRAEDLACSNAATYGVSAKGSHPVNCVSWFEADSYCRDLGKRLPSEDEWEWAARGRKRGSTYPWGEDAPAAVACWDGDGNEAGKGERKGTCPVKSHPRGNSPDGVTDLAGNVREWTSTEDGRFRVVRGGSWGDSLPAFLSAHFRGMNAPEPGRSRSVRSTWAASGSSGTTSRSRRARRRRDPLDRAPACR
jgi:sulfatase modifying factor 1